MRLCSGSRSAPSLAGCLYDLLCAIAEVVRRIGNSLKVVHRMFRDCIDGNEAAANAKTEKVPGRGGEGL